MIESIRTKWVNFLRANPDLQIKVEFADGKGGCCVLGALCIANDVSPKISSGGNWDYVYRVVHKDFKTSHDIISQLWQNNDAGWDFNVLANWIEDYVPLEEEMR